ncbi:cytidylate kinase [Aerococcus urinaehominis]|uniref:Cytidylate kinase n=1 Tax=Aerococcus urinaehominis TaxID=128944 RepID=A0A0X8FN49_9LACT|nr:(d)CMP kinase [Aerococcus urinaehominis]AMB99712.1 cytidylate kinase [Aerococcus urinaehominis]SDL91550.1 cytidylate kinase [Aerococcus urinaehominis]
MMIAIDGPASSGKSTIAKRLATDLDFIYLDTGAMYRAFSLLAIEANCPSTDSICLAKLLADFNISFTREADGQHVWLGDRDVTKEIRQDQVSRLVSEYAALRPVRQALVAKQQAFAHQGAGVVMDGRDIGTVVLPTADLKFYLTASVAERARRRYLENQDKGLSGMSLAELEAEITRRDQYDMGRAESPLRVAEDAIVIDSSDLSLDQVEQLMLDQVEQRMIGH